jgi:hypothetical protein
VLWIDQHALRADGPPQRVLDEYETTQ